MKLFSSFWFNKISTINTFNKYKNVTQPKQLSVQIIRRGISNKPAIPFKYINEASHILKETRISVYNMNEQLNAVKGNAVALAMSRQFSELAKYTTQINLQLLENYFHEAKAFLENHEMAEAESCFESLKSILEGLNPTPEFREQWKDLLAKTYAHYGLSVCFGTDGQDLAMTYFDKALELMPNYELPKNKKEAILIGRGILPEGQTLEFEDEIVQSVAKILKK